MSEVSMSDDAFDRLMAEADPAMVVVTTVADGARAGCLVGFHSQASIEPEGYCVWLSKANHTYRAALVATHFAVHFLRAEDMALAERFGTRSGEDGDKFAGVEVEPDTSGVPLLVECPDRLVMERVALVDDGGDHVCVTGRVLTAHCTGRSTVLRESAVAHLRPGRSAGDRAIVP